MTEALDELVGAALPDDAEAMSTEDQQTELAELTAAIDALGRQEEAAIEAAFAGGVDTGVGLTRLPESAPGILRRSGADPACVLGVRVRVRVVAARPARRPRPAPPADPAAPRACVERAGEDYSAAAAGGVGSAAAAGTSASADRARTRNIISSTSGSWAGSRARSISPPPPLYR